MNIGDFAELFKSLSEPVRLRLLYLLSAHEELCVCDLMQALDLPQSVVSRHLAYLRNHGLLSTRRQGVWIFYKIDPRTPFATQLLALYREFGAASTELTRDLDKVGIPNSCCD